MYRFINGADLIYCKGRILYSNNWYTTTRLAKYLYETYHWLFVGAVVANESKDRHDNSVPFRKLSPGDLKKINIG